MLIKKTKIKKIGKKGQIDIAMVVGAIIIPVSALIGALMFAWLLISPVVDLCRIAETISYDVISLTDVVYSMPDDMTLFYKGPSFCEFYSSDDFPSIVYPVLMDAGDVFETYSFFVYMHKLNSAEPSEFPAELKNNKWYSGTFSMMQDFSTIDPSLYVPIVLDVFPNGTVWIGLNKTGTYSFVASERGDVIDLYERRFEIESIYFEPSDVELERGTVSSCVVDGTSVKIADNSQTWTVNEWANQILWIYEGTGAGQEATILSNNIDTLTLVYDASFNASMDASSKYLISDATPLNYILFLSQYPSPPIGIVAPTGQWYWGRFRVPNYEHVSIYIDNPGGLSYDTYYVDVDGDNDVRGSMDINTTVGSKFQINGVNFTIQDPTYSSGVIESIVLEKEIPFSTKKDTMYCLNQRLIIPQFGVDVVAFNTDITSLVQKMNPFYSRSFVPAQIYDPSDETHYGMGFPFRSFANIQDLGVFSQGAGSVMYNVDNAVFISKTRTAYYDTINPMGLSKEDIVKTILKIASQTCQLNQNSQISSIYLPEMYNLSLTGTDKIVFSKQLVPTDRVSPSYFSEIYSLNVNHVFANSPCTYAFENTPKDFFNKDKPLYLNVRTVVSGSIVKITITDSGL